MKGNEQYRKKCPVCSGRINRIEIAERDKRFYPKEVIPYLVECKGCLILWDSREI